MNNINNVKIWSLLAITGPTRRLYGFNRGLQLSLLFLSSSAALMREAKQITRSFIIKTAQILAIFSRFKPFGASKGPLNGSLRGPWPFLLMFHTRWQYLYMEFPSQQHLRRNNSKTLIFWAIFSCLGYLGALWGTQEGPTDIWINLTINHSINQSIIHPINSK